MSLDTKYKNPGHRGIEVTVRTLGTREKLGQVTGTQKSGKGFSPDHIANQNICPEKIDFQSATQIYLSSSSYTFASSGIRRKNRNKSSWHV